MMYCIACGNDFFFLINLLLGEGIKVVGNIIFAMLLGQELQMEDFFPSWFPCLSKAAYCRL